MSLAVSISRFRLQTTKRVMTITFWSNGNSDHPIMGGSMLKAIYARFLGISE